MKKGLLPVFAFIAFMQISHSQTTENYHPFRFDIGAGFARLNPSSEHQGGFILYMEPYWNLPMHRIGVRTEGAFGLYMKSESSVLLTSDHYFLPTKKAIRPFVGGGIGLYYVSESGSCGGGPSTTLTTHETKPLGGMVRMGFELSLLRLSLEYNMVQRTYVRDFDAGKILVGTQTYSSCYFGLKAGICIGRTKESLKRQRAALIKL